MAKQTQRPAPKGKPITSNPLFPAVVALWFGALFGLSSVAVRVSVIETLVMKSGIDLVVPAAAPPLGITARILVALIMAALGALLGTVIGRRLARPKVEVRERKRNAKASEAEQPRVRTRDSHPDAPVRKPISAHEEFGGDPVRAETPATPGLLANRRRGLTAEPEPQAFVPQEQAPLPGGELQILDLAGAEIEPHAASVAVQDESPSADLNAFDSEDSAPEPAAEAAWSANLAETGAMPQAGLQDLSGDDPACERQIFHATTLSESPESMDADADLPERQIFGLAPVAPQHPDDRQVFGVSSDAAPALDVVQAAGFQASVFNTPPPPPLFAERNEPAVLPGVLQTADAPTAAYDSGPAPLPEPLPCIADLDMTDLAVRLQESMKRRRAARDLAVRTSGASVAFADVSAPPPMPPMPRLADGPQMEASDVVTADHPAASEPQPTFPEAIPVPAVHELPAALRPLVLDAFADEDEDDETLASLLPPRHIAMPPITMPAAAPLFAPPTAEDDGADEPEGDYASLLNVAPLASRPSFVRIEEPQPEGDAIEPVVIFPGQGPRVPLGSMMASTAHEVAPVVSPSAADPAPLRRFDAPANAGPGQPISANAATSALDPDEAERSLRSALANLQRISGAA